MKSNVEFYEKFRERHTVKFDENVINCDVNILCYGLRCRGCVFDAMDGPGIECDEFNNFTKENIESLKQKYPEDFL